MFWLSARLQAQCWSSLRVFPSRRSSSRASRLDPITPSWVSSSMVEVLLFHLSSTHSTEASSCLRVVQHLLRLVPLSLKRPSLMFLGSAIALSRYRVAWTSLWIDRGSTWASTSSTSSVSLDDRYGNIHTHQLHAKRNRHSPCFHNDIMDLYNTNVVSAKVMIWIDDTVVFHASCEDYRITLRRVFQRLVVTHVQFNPTKTDVCVQDIASGEEVTLDPASIQGLTNLEESTKTGSVHKVGVRCTLYYSLATTSCQRSSPGRRALRGNWNKEITSHKKFAPSEIHVAQIFVEVRTQGNVQQCHRSFGTSWQSTTSNGRTRNVSSYTWLWFSLGSHCNPESFGRLWKWNQVSQSIIDLYYSGVPYFWDLRHNEGSFPRRTNKSVNELERAQKSDVCVWSQI